MHYLYATSVKYLLLLALPLAAGTTVLASPILATIFGVSFETSVPIAQVLIWSLVPAFIHALNGRLLLADNREMLIVRLLMVSLAVNVVVNILLLPGWGATGAAIARVTSTLVVFIAGQYLVSQQFKAPNLIALSLRPALAATLMAGALFQLQALNIWILVPLGLVIYVLTLLILRTFSNEDLRLLRQIAGMRVSASQAA